MLHFVKTEVAQLCRLAKQSKNVIKSVQNYYDTWQDKVVEGLTPCVTAFESLPGISAKADVKGVVNGYCGESCQMVLELLANGTPRDMLEEEVKELTRNWVDTRVEPITNQLCEG